MWGFCHAFRTVILHRFCILLFWIVFLMAIIRWFLDRCSAKLCFIRVSVSATACDFRFRFDGSLIDVLCFIFDCVFCVWFRISFYFGLWFLVSWAFCDLHFGSWFEIFFSFDLVLSAYGFRIFSASRVWFTTCIWIAICSRFRIFSDCLCYAFWFVVWSRIHVVWFRLLFIEVHLLQSRFCQFQIRFCCNRWFRFAISGSY